MDSESCKDIPVYLKLGDNAKIGHLRMNAGNLHITDETEKLTKQTEDIMDCNLNTLRSPVGLQDQDTEFALYGRITEIDSHVNLNRIKGDNPLHACANEDSSISISVPGSNNKEGINVTIPDAIYGKSGRIALNAAMKAIAGIPGVMITDFGLSKPAWGNDLVSFVGITISDKDKRTEIISINAKDNDYSVRFYGEPIIHPETESEIKNSSLESK
jgi:hypothetical protein